MKKLLSLLLIFLSFAGTLWAAPEKLTSLSWTTITRQRKIYFVLGSMESFQEKGVVFRHTMEEYICWLDQAASSKASSNDMDTVFARLVVVREGSSVSTATKL